MARWLVAAVMIVIGIGAVYQAITDPSVRLRGSKRNLPAWAGRIFLFGLAAMSILGGILVWLSRFDTGSK